MHDLFPGEARPVPAWTGPGWTITFGPDEPPPPPPVTHAEGYEPFVTFAQASGADPHRLAGDVDVFAAFVRGHAAALADPTLLRAAAVFVGNALVLLHPGATWHATQEPEVGTDGMSITVDRIVPALIGMPEEADLRRLLATWDAEDARYAVAEKAIERTRTAAESAAVQEAPAFVRPVVPVERFLNDDGSPIPYGDRWAERDGTPPDDAYERVSHPERFAPLHVVARALVAHLEDVHEVAVERTPDMDGQEIVVLRPSVGAPIRLTFTAFPGLRLRAGLLLDRAFPSCGCDACDEDAASQLDELEQTVLGVTTGGLAELVSGETTGSVWLSRPDGGGEGGGGRPDEDDRLVEPEAVVSLDGRAWPAWPLRDRRG